MEREGLIDNLEQKINSLKKKKQEYESDLVKFRDKFRNSDDVRNHLLGLKPYVDFLNGIVPTDLNGESDKPLGLSKPNIKEQAPNRLEDYINEVRHNLNIIGREIEFNELANYIINIHQSFLSVFAGLPGVGKTSLVTKLVEALGFKNRFLPISVSKGWTSTKDLIGYFNPLSNQFQASKTNFYHEVIERYQFEIKQELDIPYYVLLDEANLSPIEHYWSDFMRLTDPESEKIISIGGKEGNIHIGKGLRFIATINYDHTTEVLSPRLIDRAPIILLNPKKDLIDNLEINNLPKVQDYLSTEQLNALFYNPNGIFKEDERLLFLEIKNNLENDDTLNFGNPIIISPRKQNSVINYCSTGRLIFKEESLQFTALDYAVLQHILPLINGRGEKFKKRLEALSKTIERSLPKTSFTLNQIISSGISNYNNFKFFN
ncbi:hypothetical protein AHMF7605_06820 [Adhaeribacter arboris]|uniref:AAA+ ATPase domain-containing protein n=1 Tax=Adhaeribacter arboris TaxID=2072846 RepID=A0A2T2YCL3_9BACT|nr:hypothetical protein [Adhaeribacter arboris]PSR53262.1 hypothetical protein AHMF7605_06820 [Adhaeribacter arboris]